MAYSDFTFDPTGQLAANKITNEVQSFLPGTTVAVFPEHGAFFAESIKVEGRKSGGTWAILNENKDYVFSPLFLNASARTTRSRIFSYVVLNAPDAIDVDEVRLTYQALGEYQDDKLLAQIIASGIDRTKPWEWAKLLGSSIDFKPAIRDQQLKDVHVVEILQRQFQLMAETIADPYAGGKNYSQDIVSLQLRTSNQLTLAEYEATLKKADKITDISSGVAATVYTMPADTRQVSLRVHFESSTGDVDSAILHLSKSNSQWQQLLEPAMQNNGSKHTLNVVRSGDTLVVNTTATVNGKVWVKKYAEIA